MYFTCKGRNDGIGAQACGIISIMVVADAFGLKYVHTPMRFVAHYPYPNPTDSEKKLWCLGWEQLLNFGFETPLLTQTSGVRLHLDHKTIASHFKLNSQNNQLITDLLPNKVYSTREVHDVLTKFKDHERMAQAWKTVLNRIRKGYSRSRSDTPHFVRHEKCVNIAVHVRRGDSTNNARRFVDHSYFVNVLDCITKELTNAGKPYSIHIYSEGVRSDLPEFERFRGVDYRLNEDHFDTLHHLACADILVMSKSTFSYLPALLNDGGIVIYKPFWLLPPKPLEIEWISPDDDGKLIFDVNKLRK